MITIRCAVPILPGGAGVEFKAIRHGDDVVEAVAKYDVRWS